LTKKRDQGPADLGATPNQDGDSYLKEPPCPQPTHISLLIGLVPLRHWWIQPQWTKLEDPHPKRKPIVWELLGQQPVGVYWHGHECVAWSVGIPMRSMSAY
jgi:hypothetical protein